MLLLIDAAIIGLYDVVVVHLMIFIHLVDLMIYLSFYLMIVILNNVKMLVGIYNLVGGNFVGIIMITITTVIRSSFLTLAIPICA